MKEQNGFSLIELLIVVVIIGVIAAVAIPNLLASRRAANESSAISTLRTYHGAQATYASTVGNGNFAGVPFMTNAFTTLGQANIIDAQLASGRKSGYDFAGHSEPSSPSAAACHLAQGYPIDYTSLAATGRRIFVIATEGVLYGANFTGAAGWGPNPCDIAVGMTPITD